MYEQRQVSSTSISLISDDEDDLFDSHGNEIEAYDEKKWTRAHLRSQFETLELYDLFRTYTDKINFGYFSSFLILTFLLFLSHTVLLLAETIDNAEELRTVLPDIILYSLVTVLAVVGFVLLETVQHHQTKWNYTCYIAFAVITATNFFVPIYHDVSSTMEEYTYMPAYTFLVVIGCYMYFGIKKNLVAACLGVAVSVGHVTILVLITYKKADKLVATVFSDVIFLVCFNGLGLYFRYLNEIVQRKSFLDRRDCIHNTFQLRHEKKQEEQLMASIIPAPLIDKVKQSYIRSQENYRKFGRLGLDNPEDLLETHEGVTILFADIVNYTVMTKQLNINDLLEVLNELFGRFDDASDGLKVIRIKFLGDCYYCVSGLPPNPPSNPAEACVDLGLAMIKIIADVRERNNLTIDMRIGIHTGRIISGIIGKVKYQFDVWSKDVDIANKMESAGVPGKVHITSTTRALLRKPYDLEPRNIEQFRQYGLGTFLVSPSLDNQSDDVSTQHRESNTPVPRPSLFRKNGAPPQLHNLNVGTAALDLLAGIPEEPRNTLTIIESSNMDQDKDRSQNDGSTRQNTVYQRRPSQRFRVNEDRRLTFDIKRRTAFMNSNSKRYIERAANVNKEMEKTIKDMSFSKRDQYSKENEINSLLVFKNKNIEMEYVKMKDPMFKYYVSSQVVLILCVYVIQNMTLESRAWLRYEFIISQLILVLVLLPSTWTYYLYLKFYTQFVDAPPSNRFLKFFYDTSKFITYNFWARLTIYTVVWMLFLFCVFVEVWICHNESLNNPDQIADDHCMEPWHMTESCALALIMTFLFLRIFLWIKLLYAVLTAAAYSYCVLYFVTPIYQSSETFNPHLSPQVCHVLSVIFLMVTLHLVDRQTDYMNRLDFLWTSKLLEEKRKANEQQMVNTNMLINILPRHVAKIYLDVNKEMNDLYYESHNHAAVMFASIIFDEVYTEDEMAFLKLMNQYITIMDTLINRKDFSKVEKIKIAKWTYMAACGLTVKGDGEMAAQALETHHTSSTLEVLLNFAVNIFKLFKEHNASFMEVGLRIGICHGPIVAGVVGSKKPLYDIWGDAVNMASRMDSTGQTGQIQVLEETAMEIEKLGYECVPRGVRTVKGVGNVPTYFVKMDENFNLVRLRQKEVVTQ